VWSSSSEQSLRSSSSSDRGSVARRSGRSGQGSSDTMPPPVLMVRCVGEAAGRSFCGGSERRVSPDPERLSSPVIADDTADVIGAVVVVEPPTAGLDVSLYQYHKCMLRWLNGIALHRKPISELRSVTCHMGSHSVTCHRMQLGFFRAPP